MNEVKQEIVPFGKFKGQPIERLYEDPSYVKWISEQDGIKQRYPQFYNLVINNFTSAPVDTPEHNEMQIKFLDPLYRLKLVFMFFPDFFTYDNNHFLENIREYYQVVLKYPKEYMYGGSNLDTFRRLLFEMYEKNLFESRKLLLFEDCGSDVSFHVSYGYSLYEFRKIWSKVESHFFKDASFRIELKPSIGDDFPTVFREMKQHKSNLLILKNFTTSTITFDQLKQYFKTENISVIIEDSILNTHLPKYDKKIIFDKKEFGIENYS